MKKLTQWDADEVKDIQTRAERYKVLNAALENSVKTNNQMPEAEFEELQSLQSWLANDSLRLLNILNRCLQ